jgi:hypothetical protein
MSTVDPRITRAEKAEQALRSGRSLAAAVVLGFAHLALWALAGYGFGQTYDSARLSSINQVGPAWQSRFDGELPWLFIVGITLGAILGFLFTGTLRRFTGGAAALLGPLVTGSFGIALGIALFYPDWTAPQRVGQLLGFLDADPPVEWGVGAWISYWLPVWLPALFAAIGSILLVVTLLVGRAAQRKTKRMLAVVETGTRVEGRVSEVRATGVEISGLPYLQFSVAFRDHAGVDRWVTKKSTFPTASIPREGDPALVWFDPQHVADQSRIVVGLGPDATHTAR